MKRLSGVFTVLAVLLFFPLQAFADTWNEVPSSTELEGGSPISISEVAAYRTANYDETLLCVSFINKASSDATAVKFEMFALDAFQEPAYPTTLQLVGTYSPNVPIQFIRSLSGVPRGDRDDTPDDKKRCFDGSLVNKNTQAILIRVGKVLLSDGTVWTAPDYGKRYPIH